MRAIGGLLLTVGGLLFAVGAQAQTVVPAAATPNLPAQPSTADDSLALFKAAFAPAPTDNWASSASDANIAPAALKSDPAVGGAFVLPAYTAATGSSAELANVPHLVNGQGLAVSSSQELTVQEANGAVDSVRMTLGGLERAPGGVVLAGPNGRLLGADTQDVDVRYTRGWPSALTLSAGGYGVEVSPHAGFGLSSTGGSAEAGATVHFGAGAADKIAHGLGLRTVDPKTFAGKGRWYLFAAASGQTVGLNMTGNGQGGLQRSGWSSEPSAAMISDAQAGLGWRKGAMLASVGYVHREIKGMNDPQFGPNNQTKLSDSMVAFSLSFRPH
jgi:hypothetical protein